MRVLISALACLAVITCARAQAPDALTRAVHSYVKSQGETELPPFRYASVSLNGDNEPDAVVLLTGPSWCGSGGCSLLVFRGIKGQFSLVSTSSVTLEPVRLTDERRNRWASLIVHSRGRGEVLMRYDGKQYPGNPSRQPLASAGQIKNARVVID